MIISAFSANHRLNDLSRSIDRPDRQQKRPRDAIAVSDKVAIRIAFDYDL